MFSVLQFPQSASHLVMYIQMEITEKLSKIATIKQNTQRFIIIFSQKLPNNYFIRFGERKIYFIINNIHML